MTNRVNRCNATAGSCVCWHEVNHESPHECIDKTNCNGAWEDRPSGFTVIRFPGLEVDRVSGAVCRACVNDKHRECDELRFERPCACIICAGSKRRIARA